jgi:hypothetical protein
MKNIEVYIAISGPASLGFSIKNMPHVTYLLLLVRIIYDNKM